MKTATDKRILDYGYYADLVEFNNGNLRIDVNKEQMERMEELFNDKTEEYFKDESEINEIDAMAEILAGFEYLEFIADLGNDMRFGALTSSPALYHKESNRLWWYPNYQIHNLFQRLIEDKEIVFTLAE